MKIFLEVLNLVVRLSEEQVCQHATIENVFQGISDLRNSSSILADMEYKKEIKIIGGVYDISTGKVTFYENK